MRHILALATAVILNASANLLLKFGMHELKGRMDSVTGQGILGAARTMFSAPYIIIGLIFFALNVPLYAFALGKFKVSLAYPIMTGCGFGIIVLVASFSGLQERMNGLQWLGISLILLGVILVSSQLQN